MAQLERKPGRWSDLMDSYAGQPLRPVERLCQFVCEVGMVAMTVIVLIEIITRNVFNFSFQISDEVGGYIVVGLTFLALPVCQVRRAYHHVLFIQSRLSPRLQTASHLLFDLLCLLFCLILVWQLSEQVISSYQSGDVAPTELATPLWIPQLVMPIGSLALTFTLLRDAWRNVRRLTAVGERGR